VTSAPGRVGRWRWVICGLLFTATVISYVDRQVLPLLKPNLQQAFQWNEITYAGLVIWFQAAYAASYLGFGWLTDRIGARLGYALAMAVWTVAHIAHAFAGGLGGFVAARIGLGIGEGGNFPSALKTVADWFPRRERAFATGIFNAGANVGALAAPPLVALIVAVLNWRWAFLITGSFSLIWLAAWLLVYRRPEAHRRVGEGELAHIRQDDDGAGSATRIPWVAVLLTRETWAYALGRFLIDPIWWVFLFWLPDFLARVHHLDLKGSALPLVAIYLLSDIGSVAGGWLSGSLIRRGVKINAARKLTLLVCALFAVPIVFGASVGGLWAAVGLIGLATAAHQGFSANLYTLPSDLFPPSALGSVLGIGGCAGAVGGMFMSGFTGWVLQATGSYVPIFLIAGCAYLTALLAVQLLTPRMAPVRFASV
jgi:ACS family hexuronate transporter-like MFS transporter